MLIAIAALAGCGPPRDPCRSPGLRLVEQASKPYVGTWQVVRGDTVTFPQMGDRFKLSELVLDTARLNSGGLCRFRGTLVFTFPRRERFDVAWMGQGGEAYVYGWPADLGPFGGLGLSFLGARDSVRAALLFDSRLNVNVPPGVTAQFVARRVPSQ